MKIKYLAAIVGGALLLVSSFTRAAIPLDNRLYPIIDTGFPRIEFTGAEVNYKPGKTKRRGSADDTVFFAESTVSSTFTLTAPGYNGTSFSSTDLIIDAKISPKGTFKEGTFGFYSTDPLFGFGTADYVDYNCNNAGKNCDQGGLVYGGDLYSFGWSGTEGILEFGTINQAGWAWDLWGNGGPERIILDVGVFDLNNVNAVTGWSATDVSGTAIIPVPAAVWLFGSGLLGLVGIARRKRA